MESQIQNGAEIKVVVMHVASTTQVRNVPYKIVT